MLKVRKRLLREKGDWREWGLGSNQNVLYTCMKLSKNKNYILLHLKNNHLRLYCLGLLLSADTKKVPLWEAYEQTGNYASGVKYQNLVKWRAGSSVPRYAF